MLLALAAAVVAVSIVGLEVQRRGVRIDMPGEPTTLLVLVVAALSITLIRLPVLLHRQVIQAGVFLPFVLCVAWAWPRARPIRAGIGWLAGGYLAVLVVALYRGRLAGVYANPTAPIRDGLAYLLLAVFAITLLAGARDNADRDRRLAAFALAPGIYMLANMVLHLAGFEPVLAPGANGSIAAGLPADTLAKFGVTATRVQFPMGTGINAFGAMAAVALAVSGVLAMRSRGALRWAAVAGAAGSAYCVLYSDTRGPMFAAIAVLLLFAFAKRIRAASGIAVLVPLSPFLVLGAVSALGQSVARSGTEAGTGSGRSFIWTPVLRTISTGGLGHLLAGWGAQGQITSGASMHYAYLFYNQPDPYSAPAHNFMLQTMLDAGLIGLAAALAAFVTTIVVLQRAAAERPRSPAAALLAGLLVVALSGATDALPTVSGGQEMLIFGLFTIAAAASYQPVRELAWTRRTVLPAAVS